MVISVKPITAPAATINLRGVYLSCLGTIHLIAYWSYYAQFPGLLSASGIEPVSRIFQHAAPSLHQRLVAPGLIDEDSLCEFLTLTGMLISALIACGVCQHGSLFGVNVAIYGLLVRTGGTFYSFQWDTLLLETTAITCVTYAPWTRMTPSPDDTSPVAPIPLRFLLFKLMFMSGVVKLQAQCPTWEQLTALEFHFATQCLPGPLAWYVHQLPPFLLRCGVAATLWIEIPATILLGMPFATTRRIGAILQILLQLLIILTGNYNFFNLLTIALCIPVWGSICDVNKVPRFWEHIICWGFLFSTLVSMFRIEHASEDGNLNITLVQDSIWIQPQVFLPLVPHLTLLVVAATSLSTKSIPKILHGLVCLWVIGVVALPLTQIHSHDQFLRPHLARFHQTYTQPYWLINGYGLFRRMTGVGNAPYNTQGWAGVPPSVVARPEIILEVGTGNDHWEEVDLFRWKPGPVTEMPAQMAPHQPRLDWQMWFAALGSINHNPWLVHLIHKLLIGCEPVLDLVGAPSDLRADQVRAKLYHYDFTRFNTTWSRTIPGVEFVEDYPPAVIWTRKLAYDYLPPVGVTNLTGYLRAQRYEDFCVDPNRPCAHFNNSTLCFMANTTRRLRIYLLVPLGVLLWWVSRLLNTTKQRAKQKTLLASGINWEEKKDQ